MFLFTESLGKVHKINKYNFNIYYKRWKTVTFLQLFKQYFILLRLTTNQVHFLSKLLISFIINVYELFRLSENYFSSKDEVRGNLRYKFLIYEFID